MRKQKGAIASPAEAHAGAAGDLALIGANAHATVKNERAKTGSKKIVGENASRREPDSVGVVEAAPTCAHGEVLARQKDWLRQRSDRSNAFSELLIAAAETIDVRLQAGTSEPRRLISDCKPATSDDVARPSWEGV
jgi:hypothetical protein